MKFYLNSNYSNKGFKKIFILIINLIKLLFKYKINLFNISIKIVFKNRKLFKINFLLKNLKTVYKKIFGNIASSNCTKYQLNFIFIQIKSILLRIFA